jgi:hypothetical protein
LFSRIKVKTQDEVFEYRVIRNLLAPEREIDRERLTTDWEIS